MGLHMFIISVQSLCSSAVTFCSCREDVDGRGEGDQEALATDPVRMERGQKMAPTAQGAR